MIPATVEWVVEEAGLQLYSSVITPAKGGPLLHLGAHYPYAREGVAPLTEEKSNKLRKQVKEKLEQRGYKSKVLLFVYNNEVDYNDFRFKIILKAKDVDQEKYAEILRLWKGRRTLGPSTGRMSLRDML